MSTQDIPVTEFDAAVLEALRKVLNKDSHGDLIKSIDDAIVGSGIKSPDVPNASSQKQRCRKRSTSQDSRRDGSESPPRTSQSKKKKVSPGASLKVPYKKSQFDSVKIRFDVNQTQLAFNEQTIACIHEIAQKIPIDEGEGLRALVELKERVLDRQEDILIADKYGLEIANMVDGSKSLPISKQKMKKVEKAQKEVASLRSSTQAPGNQQPFRGQRGEQPRNPNNSYESYRSNAGPFTPGGRNAMCFKCNKPGHWAKACTTIFGQSAFSSSRYGSSGYGPKPLLNLKRE